MMTTMTVTTTAPEPIRAKRTIPKPAPAPVPAMAHLTAEQVGLLFLGFLPPMWLAGVAALAVSKILDNMEIGHNVMHGQYDWMGDPALTPRSSSGTRGAGVHWKHSHNYLHHTYTNIVGKDRDIGYGILRMTEEQPGAPGPRQPRVRLPAGAVLRVRRGAARPRGRAILRREGPGTT
jgi:fatty acid desaturase